MTPNKGMKMEWIKVSDRNPPNAVYVLVALYDSRTNVNMYFVQMAERMNEDWFSGDNGQSILGKGRSVTHWMPLPDNPKE